MTVVVNHCGGRIGVGDYAREDFQVWRALISDVSRRPNTHMKLGGMSRQRCGFGFEDRLPAASAREMAQAWRPYIEACIEAFGPERCMFESNFPPDRVAGSYRKLWNALKLTAAPYTLSEKTELFSGTALRIYG
jgi:predicted TIM-barrel fold metal-dependent hydrolase